jgi:transposase
LRELKALIDIDKEQWAGQMRDLLVDANESVRAAVAERATALPTLALRTLIKRYNAIIRRGLALHRNLPPLARQIGARGRAPHRPGHNLLIRLHKFKRDVLRFLYDFAVPFTNNEAERDLRMMKVKMKISGGFRTMAGARTFACLRSVISTARKQGSNILHTLAATPATLIHALPA